MKLRYFIHLVGDIHQPLHNIELYDNKFPTGDTSRCAYSSCFLDGQQFMIQLEDKENNTITQKLHVLTDAAGGLCSDTPTLPFVKMYDKNHIQTDERFDEINNKAKEFASACDEQDCEFHSTSVCIFKDLSSIHISGQKRAMRKENQFMMYK